MSNSDKIAEDLKKMKAQMEGTVDINYEKYNNEFIDKVAEHNRELKKEKSMNANKQIEERVEEGAKDLHSNLKGRIIYY
jgi:hypothetical protein